MNNADKQYFDLLRYILKKGTKKSDRTGTGTISVFDYSMRFNMHEGFPLLTSKKMAWKAMVIELLWFLRGDTNIKWLVENGCMIWVGDAYKKFQNERNALLSVKAPTGESQLKQYIEWYENIDSREKFIEMIKSDNEFARKHGDLGPVYGKQWRKWKGYCYGGAVKMQPEPTDQIADLIKNLKENPDSRRLMVNAWNIADLDSMTLPPCHYGFQCYTRELSIKERVSLYNKKINIINILSSGDFKSPTIETLELHKIPKRALSLKWTQRSCDCGLGIPFNIASYGLLLSLLSKEVNMIPEDLIFSGGDCHIYLNHIDQVKQQLKHKTYRLPTIEIADKSIFDIEYSDIKLINYESAPTINMPLSN